jgi:hypothetical protein
MSWLSLMSPSFSSSFQLWLLQQFSGHSPYPRHFMVIGSEVKKYEKGRHGSRIDNQQDKGRTFQ